MLKTQNGMFPPFPSHWFFSLSVLLSFLLVEFKILFYSFLSYIAIIHHVSWSLGPKWSLMRSAAHLPVGPKRAHLPELPVHFLSAEGLSLTRQ